MIHSIHVQKINTFCRAKDLVFVETGMEDGQLIYWFLDANNDRRRFLASDIEGHDVSVEAVTRQS